MSQYLITGATGMLGQYLLRDALLTQLPVAVLARGTGRMTARQRIDGLLQYWESQLGRYLTRPIVIDGDLRQDGLGISTQDKHWLQMNCHAVVHSAASLAFVAAQADDSGELKQTEPYLTNELGTARLLDVCRECQIDEFHHVSTAYVSGQRNGTVHETELDVGQTFGNDYEKSKVAAEELIRAANFLNRSTVYRPSIIVGDSQSGFASNFNGFYTPLQLGYLMAQAGTGSASGFLEQLGLTGDERKNLVPVDWVSRVILQIVRDRDSHGHTYHVTSKDPVTARELDAAIARSINEQETVVAEQDCKSTTNGQTPQSMADFHQHMQVYRAYLRDDPKFDRTNLGLAVRDTPCPVLDQECLVRLGRYAIGAGFGWPKQENGYRAPVLQVENLLGELLEASSGQSSSSMFSLALEVCGPGGGTWRTAFHNEQAAYATQGRVGAANQSGCFLSITTLLQIIQSQRTVEDAIATGAIVIEGPSRELNTAVRSVHALMSYLLERARAGKPTLSISESQTDVELAK